MCRQLYKLTNCFTPKIKVWGSRRTALDFFVKRKIRLSRCIELQALYNTVQFATNNQFFRQNSSWISPVQVKLYVLCHLGTSNVWAFCACT
jgi:hypothetical protein